MIKWEIYAAIKRLSRSDAFQTLLEDFKKTRVYLAHAHKPTHPSTAHFLFTGRWRREGIAEFEVLLSILFRV